MTHVLPSHLSFQKNEGVNDWTGEVNFKIYDDVTTWETNN